MRAGPRVGTGSLRRPSPVPPPFLTPLPPNAPPRARSWEKPGRGPPGVNSCGGPPRAGPLKLGPAPDKRGPTACLPRERNGRGGGAPGAGTQPWETIPAGPWGLAWAGEPWGLSWCPRPRRGEAAPGWGAPCPRTPLTGPRVRVVHQRPGPARRCPNPGPHRAGPSSPGEPKLPNSGPTPKPPSLSSVGFHEWFHVTGPCFGPVPPVWPARGGATRGGQRPGPAPPWRRPRKGPPGGGGLGPTNGRLNGGKPPGIAVGGPPVGRAPVVTAGGQAGAGGLGPTTSLRGRGGGSDGPWGAGVPFPRGGFRVSPRGERKRPGGGKPPNPPVGRGLQGRGGPGKPIPTAPTDPPGGPGGGGPPAAWWGLPPPSSGAPGGVGVGPGAGAGAETDVGGPGPALGTGGGPTWARLAEFFRARPAPGRWVMAHA